LGPEERQIILQDVNALQRLQSIPNQEQNGLAALGQQQGQQRSSQQEPEMQQLGQQFQEEDINDLMRKYFQNPTLGKNKKEQFQHISRKQPQIYEPEPLQNRELMQQSGQQLTSERAQQIADLFTSPHEKREREKLELAKKTLATKESRAEQMAADKETKKYFESALDLEKAADFSDIRLNKMENLIKKGGLPISGFYNLFKSLEESVAPAYGAAAGAAAGGIGAGPVGAAIGSAIGGLISPIGTLLRFAQRKTSPNLEEFEKLSNDFIKDAKSIFGPRITDADLKAFMATIPTLGQTDEGKLAIINNMKMFNKASRVRAEAVKEIIRENGNKRPANLQLMVEERIRPQLDQLSQEFSVV
jgi:DNA repair protein RadC